MSTVKERTRQSQQVNRTVVMLLLLAAVVGTAVAVVASVHQNRLLFAELQSLRQSADASRVEWGKLLLEQSSYAAYSRIERLANRQLLMKTPETKDVVMVEP